MNTSKERKTKQLQQSYVLLSQTYFNKKIETHKHVNPFFFLYKMIQQQDVGLLANVSIYMCNF